jgi:hypothetical protein
MTPTDITRVETYLRRTLGNPKIAVAVPKRKGATVEVTLDGEFIATLHRDDDDGEVSYSLTMTILDEDLPPPPRK